MSPELAAHQNVTRRFYTPIPDAIEEVYRRQKDHNLKARVLEYLNHDIPEYFRASPILYLSRHVATPNYETLRFIELAKPHHMPIVIGQDVKDIFVSNNSLKKALGKMPVVKYITSDNREVIENFTIINFDVAQGKQLQTINTTFGQNLIEFHNYLFKVIYPEEILMADDSEWIGRHHRGNLLEHYKKTLALLIVHGVMFENYELEDHGFVENILAPSFDFVNAHFGVRPLICDLVPAEIAHVRNWDSYPSVLYKTIKNSLDTEST